MNPIHKQSITYKPMSHERGATLIIVMFMLILIALIGVMVFKNSTSDLRIATASQISTLLFQANSNAFAKVEKENHQNPGGSLEYYMTHPGDEWVDTEIIFCVGENDTKIFDKGTIGIRKSSDDRIRTTGHCNANDPKISGGRIVTQMVYIQSKQDALEAFGGEVAGTSSNDLETPTGHNPASCKPFKGYAISLLPGYGNVSADNINACLLKKADDIATCLNELGVPNNVQVQTYRIEPKSIKCL